jgi:hypothetical protein
MIKTKVELAMAWKHLQTDNQPVCVHPNYFIGKFGELIAFFVLIN